MRWCVNKLAKIRASIKPCPCGRRRALPSTQRDGLPRLWDESLGQPAVHLCASVTVTGPRLLSDDLSKSAWNFSVSQCPRDTDHDFLTPIIWNVFSV